MKNISLIGDTSNHGGVIITTNQDNSVTVGGIAVAVHSALHSCPIPDHGITAITAVTIKSKINGKNILTSGAVAGCGAVITSPNRGVYVE